MKLSGYYKQIGHSTKLLLSYNDIDTYDMIFISKVFTETVVPEEVLLKTNVQYGGTGFYYDKAPVLPEDIEHCMPDYELYSDWVNTQVLQGNKRKEFKFYTDYSIGFTTRGCFRKCGFCVNRNCSVISPHSPIEEFMDMNRKKICLLDDNILGYKDCVSIIKTLKETNKAFTYKQGMDIRLMTHKKAELLVSCKYDGDYIFAFDNIADKKDVENKLQLWKEHNTTKGQNTKMYVFCGFDRDNVWDINFWKKDIKEIFERVDVLMKYNCKPYIMRFNRFEESPYRGMYINLCLWCNQPSLFSNFTYRELCEKDNDRKGGNSATKRYNEAYIVDNEDVAEKYFDVRMRDYIH